MPWTPKLWAICSRIATDVRSVMETDAPAIHRVNLGLRDALGDASWRQLHWDVRLRGGGQIHGADVSPPASPEEIYTGPVRQFTLRTHEIDVWVWQQVDEVATDENCASELTHIYEVEQVCQAIRVDVTLGGLAQDQDGRPPVVLERTRETRAGVLCHRSRIRVRCRERVIQ